MSWLTVTFLSEVAVTVKSPAVKLEDCSPVVDGIESVNVFVVCEEVFCSHFAYKVNVLVIGVVTSNESDKFAFVDQPLNV